MTRRTIRPASRLALVATICGVLVCAALLAVPSTLAQEKKNATPAKTPPPDDKVILPFMSADTVIVGRFDVSRLDMEAVEAYANKMLEEMFKESVEEEGDLPPEFLAEEKKEMAESMNQFRQKLAEFTEAGGHHVYMLIEADGFFGDSSPLLITPLGAGADTAKLDELLAEMELGDSASVEVAKALVSGGQDDIDALKERMAAADNKPAAAPGGERPDLAKAFAAPGADAPLRVALVPGEAARKLMEEDSPTLPEELGGGDVKVISRGVRWATLAITQKPSIAINLTVQASDAEHAKALMELFAKAVDLIKAQVGEDEPAVAKQLETLKPKLQGETITLTIDPALLQLGLFATASGEIEVDEADVDVEKAEPAKPAKPNDDGL